MGFFEEFGELMKKYNLEIHSFQVEENVRILNNRFHLALTAADLPPAVVLFRTNEGDFVPTEFKPITINNEKHNMSFINVKTNEIINLFPVEQEKKEETKTEEVKEEVKVEEEKPKKKTRKSKKTKEEVKATESPKADEEMTPEQEQQVIDTLNKLGEAIQMDWEDVPTKPTVEEEKKEVIEDLGEIKETEQVKGYKYNSDDTFYVIGPMFKKTNSNTKKFYEFEQKNTGKLIKYNTSVNCLEVLVKQDVFKKGDLKVSSDEGKKVLEQLKNSITNEYNVVICLKGWEKAPEAKQLVEYAKEQGKTIITEDEF